MKQFTYQKMMQQRAYHKRSKGIKAPFSLDTVVSSEVKRVREFNAPTVFGSLKARRGRCVLSHEKRLAILDRALARSEMRNQLEAIIEGAKRDAEKARDFLRDVQ